MFDPSRLCAPRALFALCIAAVPLVAPTSAQEEILVSGFNSGVHRYDFETGAFLGTLGNVNDPLGIVTGPDGNIYVAEEATNKVLRFDGDTFALIDAFVEDDPMTAPDENGPLNGPASVLFGEDGNLYVSSFNNDRVLRYDGTTGAYIDQFVTANSGGLNGPDAGMAWGPDGHLYVPSFFTNRVLKYDGKTGASLGVFITFGAGGLNRPRAIVFRGDGTVLVSSENSNQILLYDAQGTFIRSFISPNYSTVTGLAIAPSDGNVYASSLNVGNVRRFNGTTGAWEGVAVNVGSGSLSLPVFLSFHPDPNLRLSRLSPGTTGTFNQIRVSGATPGAVQGWLISGDLGSVPVIQCPHLLVGVLNPTVLLRRANANGFSTLSATVGSELMGVTVALQVLEPVTCRGTNLVVHTFETTP